MKKSGKNNCIQFAAGLKKYALSFSIILLTLAAMVTGTRAWLQRSSFFAESLPGGEFVFRNNLELMPLTYSVKTYFKDPNSVWRLITEDYLRAEDTAIHWTEEWDAKSPLLVPGKRTEYRTVITNLTDHEQRAMLHLKDVAVEQEIKGLITLAGIEPELMLYDTDDNSVFHDATDEEGLSWSEAELLCLAAELVIPAGESCTVKWYVSADSDIACGVFPALTDMDGVPLRTDDGNFYSVNQTDEEGRVTEAFECDALGVLCLDGSGALIPYTGDNSEGYFADVKCDDFLTGSSPRRVRISGMIVAVGEES